MKRETGIAGPRHGLFHVLQSVSGAAAVMLDAQGRLEHANASACAVLGCASPQQLAARWAEILPLLELPPPSATGAHLCTLPWSPAQLVIELHALDDDAGSGHFALLKNPLALDQFDRELILASERRGWTHQREALTHDLKGILNSMQISLELLSDPDAAPVDAGSAEGRRRRRVAAMKEDLLRMDRALRLLPGAEGYADPPVTQFDVREVIKETVASLRQLVRRNNVELQLNLPDEPLALRGRRNWIRLALFNVIVHRLGAMRAGGRLALDVHANGESLEVTLRDDAADLRDGMIDPAWRTPLSGRLGAQMNGAALDLQVARAIVEAHGGSMRATAGADRALQFSLRLPR
jgi:signal transduction histidine kinase